MSWTTPKTNWVATDYFNIGDYNRIVGNLNHLRDLSAELFIQPTYQSMVATKTYTDMLYAREFNVIESNLTALNNATYNFNIGTQKTYQANGKMPTYEEYNRIESAMAVIKVQIDADTDSLSVLPFRLGNMKGVRV